MYHPIQVASFALMHLEYFLEGLSDEDARRRIVKEDGSQMNAISWIVGHVSWQWVRHALGASPGADERLEALLARLVRFRNETDDATPPPLAEALEALHGAREAARWIIDADNAKLDVEGREGYRHPSGQNLGSLIMRATLHTWCHGGEINAIRQMMGHNESMFVLMMTGNMDWRPEGSDRPEWVTYPPPMSTRDADFLASMGQAMPSARSVTS